MGCYDGGRFTALQDRDKKIGRVENPAAINKTDYTHTRTPLRGLCSSIKKLKVLGIMRFKISSTIINRGVHGTEFARIARRR